MTARHENRIQALELVSTHLALAGENVRLRLRGMGQAERERRGWQGPAWRQRIAEHSRVRRTLRVLLAIAARNGMDVPPPDEGSERERAAAIGRATDHYPPAQERGRTAGEEAQLGMSLAAGPGGENGSQDPRRFPPSFHGGNWTCCLINPTSVGAHTSPI